MVTLADAPPGAYEPPVVKIVVETVSSISGRPIEAVPLNRLLVRDIGLTCEQKGAVLGRIEQRLGWEVYDGLYCSDDFTPLTAIELYSEMMRAATKFGGSETLNSAPEICVNYH